MDPFTASFLSGLAAELGGQIIPKAARRLQTGWQGDASAQALARCLQTGILGMVSKASLDEPDQEALLAGIFRDFFQNQEVAIHLMALVRLQPLNLAELAALFEEAGYDAETLPGLRFPEALAAFEAAFLEATALEPALQPVIQVHQRGEQTALQREMVTLMRQMLAALQEQAGQAVGIQAGRIVAENVVGGTQIIYQWPAGFTLPPARSWEKHYLRTLLGYCDALDLAAVDELYASDQEAVRVSDVFTSLYLARGLQIITRAPEQPVAEAILKPAPETGRGAAKQGKDVPVTAVEAVAALDRLVILGYPGGGKSTLVNYLAAQMARRRLGQVTTGEALPGWPADTALLPVRIILRHFAAALPEKVPPGPKGGLVWDYLAETLLPQWGCQEALDELKHTLTEEGGLVLFDGLDEVRESDEDARRSLIKEAIADFATPLTRCKVIVTCREYAYKAGDAWRLPARSFPVVDLALFTPAQIQQFTRSWYQLTGPFKGWDADRCRREAERLYEATQQWPHLRELAQYPLLLTLMTQVHGRDGTLPEDRADLYERAVNLLLAHWENRIEREVAGERLVEPGLIVQLGVRTETLKGALAQVAFQAHERQEQAAERDAQAADISRDELWEALQAVLGSYDRAKQVTDYVQFRAGLLQARDRFTYTFPHRTFQEYLAALHLWKEASPGEVLAERVKRDLSWWREVFLLAAGQQKTTPKNVAELVDWLLPAGPDKHVTTAQAELAALAGQALADTEFARHTRPQEPDYRFTVTLLRIKAWLQVVMLADTEVLAGVRAAAGRALGRLTWPDGRLLDNRPGVGTILHNGQKLPDIVWGGEVPAGTYTIGDDRGTSDEKLRQVPIKQPYRLACYPVTYAQFQCFVDAPDFGDERWWAGMPGNAQELGEQAFPFTNHPREMVSWYQAMAFGRWLTAKLHAGELPAGELAGDVRQYEITLPHEYEWEVAARWPKSDMVGRIYPWGPEFDAAKANTREGGIGQTTAVGMYPAGRNAALGLYDLSGNVWEWCRNKYKNPDDEAVDGSGAWRVLRGGSWFSGADDARAASRYDLTPAHRSSLFGFRLVVVGGGGASSPIS